VEERKTLTCISTNKEEMYWKISKLHNSFMVAPIEAHFFIVCGILRASWQYNFSSTVFVIELSCKVPHVVKDAYTQWLPKAPYLQNMKD